MMSTIDNAILGIELGSTRIKAALSDENGMLISSGSFVWENRFENGYWTYSKEDIIHGIQACFSDLRKNVIQEFGCDITHLNAIGISAMMHGYIVIGEDGEWLVPFRTWRNTTTNEAATKLTNLFGFNIPQRWSIAHLYQAILNMESHLPEIKYMTTLSGYIHYLLTGERVLGVGDASGMFPIDSEILDYDKRMISQFNELIAAKEYLWKIEDILPSVKCAGDNAGYLTEFGASLLDPSGKLCPGIPFCPPEGDAGTGMVATNSVRVGTGNVSAGTSIFGMVVLRDKLSRAYKTIDMVTTPDGKPVAMVHCNNCTSSINQWVGIFKDFMSYMDVKCNTADIYKAIFSAAEKGSENCGGLLNYNYVSGEPVVGLEEGRELIIQNIDSKLTFENAMRMNLYSAVVTLKYGFEVLENEKVVLNEILGHGGLFKNGQIGQKVLAAALETDVSVMKTAGEGGAWGMSVLAGYMQAFQNEKISLDSYLQSKVFKECDVFTVRASVDDVIGFREYYEMFKACLPVERSAVECLKN